MGHHAARRFSFSKILVILISLIILKILIIVLVITIVTVRGQKVF